MFRFPGVPGGIPHVPVFFSEFPPFHLETAFHFHLTGIPPFPPEFLGGFPDALFFPAGTWPKATGIPPEFHWNSTHKAALCVLMRVDKAMVHY